jgi:hypothetical protein
MRASARASLLTALGLAVTGATGCVVARYSEGANVREERIGEIQPGVTTRAEVLEWFGAPQGFTEPGMVRELMENAGLTPSEVVSVPFADVLVFESTKGRIRAMLLLLFNRIELRVASDRLVVFFDEQDRVLYYGYRRGTDAVP